MSMTRSIAAAVVVVETKTRLKVPSATTPLLPVLAYLTHADKIVFHLIRTTKRPILELTIKVEFPC